MASQMAHNLIILSTQGDLKQTFNNSGKEGKMGGGGENSKPRLI